MSEVNTLEEMRDLIKSDLSVSSNSSFIPVATIDDAINRSYRKATYLFNWPALNDAQYTTTQANIEYYNNPDNWRPRSMWRLTVDGDPYGETPDYTPLVFKDFLNWNDDSANDNSTDKKWAVQWLRFFIYPIPTVASLEIVAWGQKNADALTSDADTTIFSSNMPECNEAIVLEATGILRKKAEGFQAGQFVSAEAKQILITSYDKIKDDRAKYEKIEPFFEVPNFYGNTPTGDMTGRF